MIFGSKTGKKCSQVNAFLTVYEHRCEHFFGLTQGLFSRTIGSYKRPLKWEYFIDEYGAVYYQLYANDKTT
jgi:hypothetical protein